MQSELKLIYEIIDASTKNNAEELMQLLKDKELVLTIPHFQH